MMSEKFKVVISGISGHFPDSEDVEIFKAKLYNGHDFVTTDDRKWPVGYKLEVFGEKKIPDPTGKLPADHKRFDTTVFKISRSWANGCDIFNRFTLEPSFEAIVDAGINPYSLDGSDVGVFISAGQSDVECRLFKKENLSNSSISGHCKSMISNRISYVLNLKGTSFTHHCETHGGLDSLAMAYKYVSEGYGEAAIVGAASSIVDPRTSLTYAQMGLLCPDGITRPFDKAANGYARSESVICFYLQRAEDAKRNYGEIKFCDSTYLGSELQSFIGYDEKYLKMSWNHLIERKDSIFDLSDIAFVEMNACGHKFTDKTESNAVARWFSKNKKKPLMVGSVKSNVGHSEEVAGLMAVLKALLALDSGILPANLHLKNLNDNIEAFKENQLQVVTENTPLTGNMIAVNSCGLFGSVGLAKIEQHKNPTHTLPRDEIFPRILLLCGREEMKLLHQLKRIASMPSCTPEFIALTNDTFRQDMPHHLFRGFTLLPTAPQPIIDIGEKGEANRPVWFVFTGMGSQWNGMGRDLLSLPLFVETVAKCDRVLKTKDIDINKILTSDDPTLFDNIINAFVGIVTVQIGLCEVLKGLGIEPDGIIGHSTGENGCAYADGCATLEEAVLASWARGKASMEVKTIEGMMAAVGQGYMEIKDTLPEDIEVACHNSADNCTISGPAESVNAYVKIIQKKGVFAKAVNVANIAYHSKIIKPIGSKLLPLLNQIITKPKKRSSKWISTTFPEADWNLPVAEYFTPEYATNNLLSPVLFEEGCKHIPKNAICIEIAPHGLLQAILKRSLPSTCTNIPLARRAQEDINNLKFLLSAIGKLYIAGLEPQVNNIFPKVEYPVPRGTASISPYCTWYHPDSPLPRHILPHFIEDLPASLEQIPIYARYDSEYVYLKDHRIDGNIAVLPSLLIYLTWKVFSFVQNVELSSSSIIFEDVKIHRNAIVKTQDSKYVSVMIQHGSGNFEVVLRDQEESGDIQIVLTGSINLMLEETINRPHSSADQNTEDLISKSHFQNVFKRAGYSLGNEFCQISDLRHYDTGYETTVTWNGNWVVFLDTLMKVQMFANHDGNVKNIFPSQLRRLEIQAPKVSSLKTGTALTCTTDTARSELFCGGVTMVDPKYKTVPKAEIKQLQKFHFVSYENPRCQNIQEFLVLCLQIAVESADSHSKVVVLDFTKQYFKIIEEIIDKYDSAEAVVVLHPEKEFSEANGYRPTFIITDRTEDLTTLEKSATNKLMLYISPSDISFCGDQMEQRFIEITKQSFSANTFKLFKRNSQKNDYKRTKLYFFKDREEEMKCRLNGTIEETEPYFVVRNDIEFEDVSTIVKLRKRHSNARYLFIMDEVQHSKKLDELIQKQISMDLPISIFHCGVWGSYRHIISKNEDVGNEHHLSDSSAGLEEINFICMYNEKLQQSLWSRKFSGVSFATCVNNVVKRIGLAQISQTRKLLYDQYLSWTAPSGWSLEEAVTVPYFYAQAYNLLYPLDGNRHVQTVMINIGTEHLLADAIITLALYKNQIVFVTVGNDDEAILLQNKFPKLQPHQVLRVETYEVQIRTLMKGEGVHLVINCLPGIQHVDACLRCVGRFGVYTEVGETNCSDSLNAGLYEFLKCVTLRVIQNRVSDLLNLPVNIKLKMKIFLEEYLNTRAMTPPQIAQESNLSMIAPAHLKIIKCHSATEVISTGPGSIRYDSNNSYMIVGTCIEDGSWFDLVEGLIFQGARKFIIALEENSLMPTDDPKNLFLSQKDLQILFIPVSKLEDKGETNSLIKKTEEKFGPLEAIFFVSIKIFGKKLSNLDSSVSPDVHFVGLLSSGLKEFEYRKAKSSPAILIHHEDNKSNNVSDILPQLNELLIQNDCKAGVLYHAVYGKSKEGQSMNTERPSPSLRDYFPHDFETLALIGEDEVDELGFVEMRSLSIKYVHCKGVYPIFIFPAVHRVILRPLIEQLLQPVFATTSAPIPSIKCAAHKLYQSLCKIQRLGPITIVSETWTLPLALEVASHARLNDRKYRILVIEGNPKLWSEQSMHLRHISKNAKTTFADEILHFGIKNEVINDGKCSKKLSSFEDRVKMFSRNKANYVQTAANVIRACEVVQTKLDELARMRISDKPLENLTFFERYQPSDDGVFNNLSVTSEIIVVDEPSSYRSLLMNQDVSRAINMNSLFSWRLHSNHAQ